MTVSVEQYGSAVESWTTAINAIIAADQDWYCLIGTTRTKAEILELAAVIEAYTKIYVTSNGDADVLAGTADNIAEELKDLSYDPTTSQ